MAKSKVKKKAPTNPTASRTRKYARRWMSDFLKEFARGGNITQAAKLALVDRSTVYDARERDELFAAGWAEALQEAADRIRAEVTRRAIDGWEEPVFGSIGNYRDGQIGTIRKFDNGLLTRLAQAHCPEFKDKTPVGATVNVTIQVSPEKLMELQSRRQIQLERLAHHVRN